MSKIDDQTVPAALQQHLQPGEQLRNYAYGVKQPNIGLILFFYLTIGGAIFVAFMTKHYIIGLTDRRLLVVSVKPGFFTRCDLNKVVEVFDFPLAQLGSMKVKTSTGALFTHMRIETPARTWVAKFHRMGMSNNRQHTMAIADVLNNPHAAMQGGGAPQLGQAPYGQPQGAYGQPPQPGAYGQPPQGQPGQYGAPAPQGYGAPQQAGYAPPPTQGQHGAYGQPPQGQPGQYGAPPQPGYGAPPQGGYGPPQPQGGYGPPQGAYGQPQQAQPAYPQPPPQPGYGQPYPGGPGGGGQGGGQSGGQSGGYGA